MPRNPHSGRPQGGQPKHGAYVLERQLRSNELDGRTRAAKMLEAIKAELADDAGGWDNLTARERILVDRIVAASLICGAIENWVFSQESPIEKDGEMLAVLRKGYTGHAANLSRMLQALGL